MKLQHIAILFLALGCAASRAADLNDPAPSCPVPGLAGDARIDPAAHPGKVVYLDFWASWCVPCAKSFPFLDQMQRDLKGQGFEVIAINLDEERQDALGFLKKHPVGFTLGTDPMGKCPALYKVKGMPTSYLIDRKGRIRERHEGFKSGDSAVIRKEVEALLAEH